MDFSFSELQLELANLAEKILRDGSSVERLRMLEAGGQRLDAELWDRLLEAGLTAITLPESQGGSGLSQLELCLVCEQLGKTLAAVPLQGHSVGLSVLQAASATDVIDELVGSRKWLSLSVRRADNSLVYRDGRVDGSVGAVPYANGAYGLLLPVKVQNQWRLAYLAGDEAGLSLQAQQSTSLEPLALVSAKSAPAVLIDDEQLLETARYRLSLSSCAVMSGVLSESIEMTRNYVSEREQFGVKIGSFQGVAHRLADAWIDAERQTLVTYAAADAFHHADSAMADVLVAMYWSAEAGHRVMASCQHVHGGMGHDRDYPLWRYALAARYHEMAMGGMGEITSDLGERIASEPEVATL